MAETIPVVGDVADLSHEQHYRSSLYLVSVASGAWIVPRCYVIARNLEEALDDAADEGHLSTQLVEEDDLDAVEAALANGEMVPDTWHLGNDGALYWSQDTYIREIEVPASFDQGLEDAICKYLNTIREGI